MADRYWVGGTASWDGTAGSKWATSSGGTGGASVPTTSDRVFLDGASGAVTITISGTRSCLDLICTGFTGTLAGTGSLTVAGSLTLVSGMTLSHTGNYTLSSTTSGKTLTFAGKTLSGNLTFNGSGGGGVWQFQDALTSTGDLIVTAGTVDLNGKTTVVGDISGGASGTRTLTAGAASITCTGFGASAGMTFNADTSTLTCSGSFSGGPNNSTFYDVILTSTSTSNNINVNNGTTFRNLSITPPSGYTKYLLFGGITVTGLLTATGNNNSGRRVLIASTVEGTIRTITAASVSLTNVDFRDITGAGAATWSGTSIGDCGRLTNITTTPPVTRYYIAPVTATQNIFNANWATSSGGTPGSNFPLPQDTARMDANSFGSAGKIIQIANTGTRLPKMDWTGSTNAPTLNFNVACEAYGDIILASGMSVTGTGAITIAGDESVTYTSNGISYGSDFIGEHVNGNVTLGDDFVTTGDFDPLVGGLALNGFNMTAATMQSNSASPSRTISYGSGTLTLTGAGTVLNLGGTGLTLNAGTSLIKLTNNSATAKTFATGGKTYNNFWNNTAGSGSLTLTGSPTFNDLKIDPGRTVLFTAATTTTFASLTAAGTIGNIVTLASATAADHNLALTGTGYVNLDYMNITNSHASASGKFYAGNNSTNGGSNTNWIFTDSDLNNTVAASDTDDTMSSASKVRLTATTAASDTDDVMNATAARVAVTSAAVTEDSDTMSGMSAVKINATAAMTDSDDSMAGTVAAEDTNVGIAEGTSMCSGAGVSTIKTVGQADGTCTVLGKSSQFGASSGLAAGSCTITAFSIVEFSAVGTSAGISDCTGASASLAAVSGSATGTSVATAYAAGGSDGAADGTSIVSGVGVAAWYVTGASDGLATIIGAGRKLTAAAGASAGTSTVLGASDHAVPVFPEELALSIRTVLLSNRISINMIG